MTWWCAATSRDWSWAWRPYPGVWVFIALILALYAWKVLDFRLPASGSRLTAFGVGLTLLWACLDWPIGALGAGYALGNGLRLEGELSHRDNPASIGGVSANFDVRTLSLMANVFYDFNRGGRFEPYIGVGIGAIDPEFNDSPPEVEVDPGFAWQALVGVAIGLGVLGVVAVAVAVGFAALGGGQRQPEGPTPPNGASRPDDVDPFRRERPLLVRLRLLREDGQPALIRLHDAGLRVEEVPVHMRERAGGESKLQGKKAVVLVLTVIGTLLTAEYLRRKKARSG